MVACGIINLRKERRRKGTHAEDVHPYIQSSSGHSLVTLLHAAITPVTLSHSLLTHLAQGVGHRVPSVAQKNHIWTVQLQATESNDQDMETSIQEVDLHLCQPTRSPHQLLSSISNCFNQSQLLPSSTALLDTPQSKAVDVVVSAVQLQHNWL
jgi:hypothetical protein